MKRILASLLCVVMVLSVFGVNLTVSAADAFESQTNTSTPLFQIGGSNNKGGQEFIPSQNVVKGIQVYLQSSVVNNAITVAIYKGSVASGSTNKIYEETLTVGKATKWFELNFSSPVSVTPGELYCFTLNTASSAVLYGITGNGSSCLGLNYDQNAFGGWQRGNIAAFKILSKEEYQAVIDLINALPATITANQAAQVQAARNAYDALLPANKSKVTNLSKLEAAEAILLSLGNADRDALVAQISKEISAVSNPTLQSYSALEQVNQKILEFGYTYGNNQYYLIENYADFETAVEKYNELVKNAPTTQEKLLYGDVNGDNTISAKDALEVLKATVGKVMLSEAQIRLADVDGGNDVNAKDALMILQFTVGKRFSFPCQEGGSSDTTTPVDAKPYQIVYNTYSVKGEALYQATYQSMLDRIDDDGYAHTSITGAYDGMYTRDTAIQVMAHIAEGDYTSARKLLEYTINFHKNKNLNYVVHVMFSNGNYSGKQQVDATFFMLNAWVQFATTAPNNATNKAFIEGSYSKVKDFANYYLDNGNLHSKYDLIFNGCFEHTRDNSYWQSYDLLTNVYASEALHQMATYFKTLDATNAKKWEDAATKIVNGVHKNLTVEVDGALMYAELRGRSQDKIDADPNTAESFVPGFSWVNLAPMGCNWYGADPAVLEHTYQMYLKYGACRYYRDKSEMEYVMLEACTTFSLTNPRPIRSGNHIIGKGIAWELLYCAKMGYTTRIATLSTFVEEFSDKMYRETWAYAGGGADSGNQEQASWMLYAMKTACPGLGLGENYVPETDTLRVATYNIYHMGKINGNVETLAKVIRDNELDVVGMQEVDKNVGRDGPVQDQAKALADALGWYYGFSKAIDLAPGQYGNAIISKYPIESYKTVQWNSGSEEQRVMGHAVLKVGQKRVNMLNTHLSFSGLNSSQVAELAAYVGGLENYILTGDFNTQPANLTPIGATMLKTSGIDNILIKNYTMGSAVTVNNNYSDHKMIYTDVSIIPVVTGVRIASFNIHILQDVSGNVSTMAKFISDNHLEIVGLQEVDNNTGRNGSTINQAKALAEALGWYWGYSKAISLGSGEYGHAIISKYPIQSYQTIQLESGSEEQRVFSHAVIKAGDQTLNVLNTHLSWQSMQPTQIAQIADYVKGMSSFIMTGDFNTDHLELTPIGGKLVNNGTDIFITNEDGAIDNIIVKGYTVGKGTMVETDYSDHSMLYADITF